MDITTRPWLRNLALALASGALGLGAAGSALAQAPYPNRPITVVVPQAPSGGMDAVARAVTQKMGTLLNTSFVVDNKPGAGGNIGALQVAKAKPDGYTILMGQTAQFAINPHLYASMPFNPLKDLVPVVMLADAPNVLVVGPDSPFRSLADMVAAAKASKELLDFATPGQGTPSHLIGEMFQKAAGIKLVHVPYKGASGATTDTIAGRAAMMLSSIPSALPLIRSSKLRPIAVSSNQRSPSLPDVPTIAEQGYPGFNAGTWYGLFVPANTPPEVIRTLSAAANEALASKDVIAFIQKEGGTILGGTQDVFAERIRLDYAQLGKAVRESGARID
ncbi:MULTISPECIES: Bug family tripartite tricarboxylate transporter substrate binding protein [Ramlibacter]|uniref:Tripartite tricarboxylate transporter substrate binding protein n=1 Tax=Ramlibacter pinisoli TaxID=2682844 RepID=A0A6N8IXY0_9BURK|nr:MULTISPECIES: tripartite tricarboxylate transporter substrate binding protein [Ramlibacter]MBA2960944.1 tripartite tricarboxylate transporter substrate binding protein [Ramlibacter sp. CGMCC 1.13660]MVQ30890.1 tripartite tricarboxylate transporter substrate binding protein [Ramlibacter pinisoli]